MTKRLLRQYNGAFLTLFSISMNPIARRCLSLFCASFVLLTGCATRSISNAEAPASGFFGGGGANGIYRGELSEFEVLGVGPGTANSEADIAAALAVGGKIQLTKGASVMLVQSGAMLPDEAMVKGMEAFFNVTAFTGMPERSFPAGHYARSMRMAAARSGNDKIVVYWGQLETGSVNHATKSVSWVPFVGGFLKDETQRMRIRLKVALIDVRTGKWDMIMPQPFEDTDTSGRYTRASSDQAQVMLLKEQAYRTAVADLVKRFAK